MKKNLLVLIVFVCIFALTGCDTETKTPSNVMVSQLNIEEGCYKSPENSEHLICITEDSSFYEVLYKDEKYYKDDYYSTSPKTENTNKYHQYKIDGDGFKIFYFSNGEQFYDLICYGETKDTISCTEYIYPNVSPSGKTETNKIIYSKVDKTFNKDIIENLPLYERNKEFLLKYNDEEITCNFTVSYSLTESSSSLVIKNCLDKKYGKDYTIKQLNSSNNWQMYTSEDKQKYGDNINALISNFSYNVTVDGKAFKTYEGFPFSPYDTDEKMIVNITKK